MSSVPEWKSPIGHSFQRFEPIVFLNDRIYAKTRVDPDDSASFVTTRGISHALRELASFEYLAAHAQRLNGTQARAALDRELARVIGTRREEAISLAVDVLFPAFEERDWSREEFPALARRAATHPAPPDIDVLARSFPAPTPPMPSVLILGRFRGLAPSRVAGGGFRVRIHGETYVPTGETMPVESVEEQWRVAVRNWLEESTRDLAERSSREVSGQVRRVREELAHQGFHPRGDLLLFPGNPPSVGHVVPRHFNRTLGRWCDRSLAMVAPLTDPPALSMPHVYMLGPDGRWRPLSLPHGLCMGEMPLGSRPECPGLALLAFLRWAGVKIAANGIFHAHDNQDTDNS